MGLITNVVKLGGSSFLVGMFGMGGALCTLHLLDYNEKHDSFKKLSKKTVEALKKATTETQNQNQE